MKNIPAKDTIASTLTAFGTVNSAKDVSCQVSFEIVLDGKVWEIWENQSVSSDSLDFIYQKILKIREERSNL